MVQAVAVGRQGIAMFSAAAQLSSVPSTFFRQQLEYQEAGLGAGCWGTRDVFLVR